MNTSLLSEKIKDFIKNNPIKGEPEQLYQPMDYILQLGGKRVRPLVLLMAHELFSEVGEDALKAAMAIEVFHNFTLVHDDIMDAAPLRRGNETVHIKWDNNTAILSGDAMMIKSYTYLEGLSSDKLARVFPVFNKTALEVCEGQQFDMDFETQNRVDLAEYIKMIELKTSVLIGAAMKIGAIIGGSSQKDAELIYNFGRDLGIAFQLQDDFLDLYGDPKKFGKRVGGDVVANKKTFLTIKAFQKASGDLLEELEQLYSTKNLNFNQEEEKITRVREIFNKLEVGEDLKSEIDKYYQSALDSLNQIDASLEGKEVFTLFAKDLIKRDV